MAGILTDYEDLDDDELYSIRVTQLELLGCTTSDAQAVADVEQDKGTLRASVIVGNTQQSKTQKHFTNLEKISEIMEYSNFGALAQVFVMDAVSKHARLIAKTSIEDLECMRDGLISPESWQGVAAEIETKLQNYYGN